MRHAARQQAKEPAPDRPDPEAMMDRVMNEHRAVLARVRALLARDAPAEEYRILAAAMFDCGTHWEEARGELAKYAVTKPADEHIYAKGHEDGRACERAQIARESIPGPRHRRGYAAREPGEGQRALFSVKALVPVAAAFWAARKAIPAHVKLAAFTTTVLAGAGGAAFVVAPAVTHSASGASAGHGAAPAASVNAATPIPSSSQIALTLTKPKPKHAAKGKELLSASGVPAPLTGPQTGSGPSAASSPAVSVAGTLAVTSGNTQLSLGLDGITYSGSVTVTAQGGDVKWGATSNSPDVTVSAPDGLSGVLGDGGAETFTISVNPSAQLSAGSATVRIWPGVTISVTWIALPVVSVPSVVPSAVASLVPSIAPGLPG